MTLHALIRWVNFNSVSIGCFCGVLSASQLWPNLMPWGMAFWVGWLASGWDDFNRRVIAPGITL